MLSDKRLSVYGLPGNFTAKILHFGYVLDFDLWPHPGYDPWGVSHGMKANPTGYLWSKYECFVTSNFQDMDL